MQEEEKRLEVNENIKQGAVEDEEKGILMWQE